MFRVAIITSMMVMFVNCKEKMAGSGSETQVANGVRDYVSYPETVQISSPKSNCTGTFITPYIVLTAAHCFDDRYRPSDYTVAGTNNYGVDYKVHQNYVNYSNGREKDIALIKFTFPNSRFAKLGKSEFTEGTILTLLGYGMIRKPNFRGERVPSERRRGTLLIDGPDKMAGGMFHFFGYTEDISDPQGRGKNISSTPGDSGGPLFDAQGNIVATVSGGRKLYTNRGYVYGQNWTVDISQPYNVDFINQAMAALQGSNGNTSQQSGANNFQQPKVSDRFQKFQNPQASFNKCLSMANCNHPFGSIDGANHKVDPNSFVRNGQGSQDPDSVGQRTFDTMMLQEELKRLRLYNVQVNGRLDDPNTVQAIKAIQMFMGRTPTGIADIDVYNHAKNMQGY